LHNRATEGKFAAMCTAERSQMGAGGVVHSFDGDVAELKELLGLFLNGCSQDLDVAARARAAGQAASGDQRAVVWGQEKAC
jgi:Tat protein secretion system quality control protein TatD with DNase activity